MPATSARRAWQIIALAVVLLGGEFWVTEALAQSQAAEPSPSLEVASVRKHTWQEGGHPRFTVSGSRVTVVTLDAYDLILEAWSLKDYQLYGAPDWMGGGSNLSDIVAREKGIDFYDISAKAEGDAALTRDQARLILQAVLADRFQLKVHREMKDLPVYALNIGKNGPKMKESPPDAKFAAGFELRPFARMTDRKTTMTQFAGFLSVYAGRPVVNRTGLTGSYDFTLEWNLDEIREGEPGGADTTRPSIFTAVQNQLGLKLEPSRAPVEVLVIDHAEKPLEN
jgi:uncharacterized protein (TIGR03435 family)